MSKAKPKNETGTLQERVAAPQAEVADAPPAELTEGGTAIAVAVAAAAEDDSIPADATPVVTTTDLAAPDNAAPAPATVPFTPAEPPLGTWFVPAQRVGLAEQPLRFVHHGRHMLARVELRKIADPVASAARNVVSQELASTVLADARGLPEIRELAFLRIEHQRGSDAVAFAEARSRELVAHQAVLRLDRQNPGLGARLVEADAEIDSHKATVRQRQAELEALKPLLEAAEKKAELALVRVARGHAVVGYSWVSRQRAEALTELCRAVGGILDRLVVLDEQIRFWLDTSGVERMARALVDRAAAFEPSPPPLTPAAVADSPTDPPAGETAQVAVAGEVASDNLATADAEAAPSGAAA